MSIVSLCKNFSSARSFSAANVCRGMDLFESAVFGALVLANILSRVPCTEQQKRFICVNTWKFVAVVTHSMNFCMFFMWSQNFIFPNMTLIIECMAIVHLWCYCLLLVLISKNYLQNSERYLRYDKCVICISNQYLYITIYIPLCCTLALISEQFFRFYW